MKTFIFDGHKYTVSDRRTCTSDVFVICDAKGHEVAKLFRDETMEYWHVTDSDGDLIAQWHENEYPDNELERLAVRAAAAGTY